MRWKDLTEEEIKKYFGHVLEETEETNNNNEKEREGSNESSNSNNNLQRVSKRPTRESQHDVYRRCSGLSKTSRHSKH